MGPKVQTTRCCRSTRPPALHTSLGENGVVGAFLMCRNCAESGPVVSLATIGKSSWWNVAARAWNRKMAKRAERCQSKPVA